MDAILENLKKAVVEYDSKGAAMWARKAVEEEVDPLRALDGLIEGIRQVGDGYGRGELFLPELVGAAAAMTSAMPIIEERIRAMRKERKSLGIIVAGTVHGDIHNIGKDMVVTLSRAEGFEVIDLGVDVGVEKFLEAVREHKPGILAMSALLTTTALVQKELIGALGKAKLRDKVKVVVGGAAVTQEFANSIGADGYRPTAPMAVKLFRELLQIK